MNGRFQQIAAGIILGVSVAFTIPSASYAASAPPVVLRLTPAEQAQAVASIEAPIRAALPADANPVAVEMVMSTVYRCLILAARQPGATEQSMAASCQTVVAAILDANSGDRHIDGLATAVTEISRNQAVLDAGNDPAQTANTQTSQASSPPSNQSTGPEQPTTMAVDVAQNNGSAGDANNGSNQPKNDDKKDEKPQNGGGGNQHHP
jgi:hypothetical protein